MNLADVIGRNAASAPGKVAIRFAGQELTYAEVSEAIVLTARLLWSEYGIRRGDRVALLALNHRSSLVLLYACARIGAILTPLNWRLAPAELAFILGACDPKLLVTDRDLEDLTRSAQAERYRVPSLDIDDIPRSCVGRERLGSGTGELSDPLLLVYTSGTTGRPKGALLTQEALAWNGVMSGHMHGLTADDHVLTVLPFFHVGGLNIQTTPALQVGATVTVHARFDAGATLAAIAADRPSLTVLVPATLQACLDHPTFATTDLSSLRAVATGSTYVPQPLIDAFEARGVPVLQVYGATETGPISIYTRLGGERRRPGSTGWPGLFCEAKVVDDDGEELRHGQAGEIWVRAPNVFSGYWRDEAASAGVLRDGWFRTGDIATRDPDGAITVHDRKKNVVISGGENIYPAEIERVLLDHPAVAEAAVIGRPDPRWGETPVAFVVLRDGARLDCEALGRHVAGQLARFKLPREYRFVEALPRTALGKVQHHLLRETAT